MYLYYQTVCPVLTTRGRNAPRLDLFSALGHCEQECKSPETKLTKTHIEKWVVTYQDKDEKESREGNTPMIAIGISSGSYVWISPQNHDEPQLALYDSNEFHS